MLLGVGGILLGDSTGYQWLGVSALRSDHSFRRLHARCLMGGAHVSLFGAANKFTLRNGICSARFSGFRGSTRLGQLMLFVVPVQGVLQSAVGWWYANNLLFLWFGAIGLGTAYYMIPKVIGSPGLQLSSGDDRFLSYALFSSWTGMQRLVDGPFPAWMITASIAATILTMIPVATVGLNHHMTMQGYFPLLRYSPTLRFTVFGAMSYTVFSRGRRVDFASLCRALRQLHAGEHRLFASRSLRVLHHGDFRFDVLHRAATGRTRMALRFTDQTAFLGIGLRHRADDAHAACRRLSQGANMENPSLAFSESTETVLPYLRGRSLSGILLTASHFIFAYHFGLMLLGLGRTSTVPTFLNPVGGGGF